MFLVGVVIVLRVCSLHGSYYLPVFCFHFFISMVLLLLGYSWKNPHPPTDGILEILMGGGVKDPGNPGGRGCWTRRRLLQGSFQRILHAIRTFSSVTLKDVPANCFCASLLRTEFIAQYHATSCIERARWENCLSTHRTGSRFVNFACNLLS